VLGGGVVGGVGLVVCVAEVLEVWGWGGWVGVGGAWRVSPLSPQRKGRGHMHIRLRVFGCVAAKINGALLLKKKVEKES